MSAELRDILAEVVPSLRAKGYKGSGQNYRLVAEKSVSIINVQKSSGGERFYINVGVQPLFVPTVCHSTPDAKGLKEPDCIFRTRLDPPEQYPHGWPYSTDVASDLVTRFDEFFASWITPLMTIPGPITDACVADFPLEAVHPLFGARHAGNFLHFARIALATGNYERAVDFASVAMEICPPRASTLLEYLQQTLSDAQSAD